MSWFDFGGTTCSSNPRHASGAGSLSEPKQGVRRPRWALRPHVQRHCGVWHRPQPSARLSDQAIRTNPSTVNAATDASTASVSASQGPVSIADSSQTAPAPANNHQADQHTVGESAVSDRADVRSDRDVLAR